MCTQNYSVECSAHTCVTLHSSCAKLKVGKKFCLVLSAKVPSQLFIACYSLPLFSHPILLDTSWMEKASWCVGYFPEKLKSAVYLELAREVEQEGCDMQLITLQAGSSAFCSWGMLSTSVRRIRDAAATAAAAAPTKSGQIKITSQTKTSPLPYLYVNLDLLLPSPVCYSYHCLSPFSDVLGPRHPNLCHTSMPKFCEGLVSLTHAIRFFFNLKRKTTTKAAKP